MLSEGGKGSLPLLDAAVSVPFISSPVVSEGRGGKALLFLFHESQGFSAFLFFGHDALTSLCCSAALPFCLSMMTHSIKAPSASFFIAAPQQAPQQTEGAGATDARVSNPASRDYDSTYRGRCPQGIWAGRGQENGTGQE